MKIRLLLALVGLAIRFAVPAFAQEKKMVDRYGPFLHFEFGFRRACHAL